MQVGCPGPLQSRPLQQPPVIFLRSSGVSFLISVCRTLVALSECFFVINPPVLDLQAYVTLSLYS
jgi:hypothetical protein